jgi:tetratricopeptide (TPR) repeat protein
MLKTQFCRKNFTAALITLFLVGLFSFDAFAQGGDLAQWVKAFDDFPQVFVSPTKRNITESEKSVMLEALNTSETLKKQADEACAKGNYAETVRLSLESARAVNTIIKLFPDSKLALLLRATKERNILLDLIKANAALTLAQKVNHQNNALRYVEAAIIVQPNDPETHYLKARIYEDTADYYLPPASTSYGSSSSFLDSRPGTPVAKPKEYAENLTKALEAAQKAVAINSTNTKFHPVCCPNQISAADNQPKTNFDHRKTARNRKNRSGIAARQLRS